MTSTRRTFMGQLGAAGLLSIGSLPPAFLTRAALAGQTGENNSKGRALVLVQLAGGNDGLNTVIPFAEDDYYKNRPGIGIAKGAVRKLDDYHGLHPAMEGFQKLFDDGMLAVVQGVGYPDPDRSHFRSMDFWHSAQPGGDNFKDGWVGRTLDQTLDSDGAGKVPALCLGEEKLPLALVSTRFNIPNVQNLDEYRLRMDSGSVADRRRRRELMETLAKQQVQDGSALDFLRQTALTSYTSADQLERMSKSYKPAAEYPQTGLANKLKLVAQVLASDMGTRIFFVSLDGFDTHSAQEGGHAALLAELCDAVRAFLTDLAGHGEADRVLVATFSEFGRRLKENGSLGTDHGAASQMFLASAKVKGGIHGKHPSLTDLDSGDLKYHTDFRSVYATLIEKWLQLPSQPVLGGKFDPLEGLL